MSLLYLLLIIIISVFSERNHNNHNNNNDNIVSFNNNNKNKNIYYLGVRDDKLLLPLLYTIKNGKAICIRGLENAL